MPKSVCVICEIELRPKENGVIVVEMFDNPPKPYKIWSADLWKCSVCGLEVVLGFGNKPFMAHYTHDLAVEIDSIKKHGATIIYDYEKFVKERR